MMAILRRILGAAKARRASVAPPLAKAKAALGKGPRKVAKTEVAVVVVVVAKEASAKIEVMILLRTGLH